MQARTTSVPISNMVSNLPFTACRKNHLALTQRTGSWSHKLEPGKAASETYLNSNRQDTREPIKYTKKDIEAIEKWGMLRHVYSIVIVVRKLTCHSATPYRDHLALSGNLQYGSARGQLSCSPRCRRRAPQRPWRQGPQGLRLVHLPGQRRLQHLQRKHHLLLGRYQQAANEMANNRLLCSSARSALSSLPRIWATLVLPWT